MLVGYKITNIIVGKLKGGSRGMEVNHRLEDIRLIIVEAFGSSLGVYGMNETIGRIYGLLYLEDKILSLKEVADNLGVSKATVSINIRLLLDLKMVHKVWQKGSRKDFYTAERDFEKILHEVLKNKEMKQVSLIKESINRAMECYNELLNLVKDQKMINNIESDIEKIEKLRHWIIKGESWLNFILETSFGEESTEDLKEIEIEWGE